MSDAISNAISTAKKTGASAASNAASAAVSSAADAAKAALPPAAGAAADKLKSLPINKDPELLKKQAEAEVLSKKAQAEQFALVAKDLAIEYGKKKLIELAIKSIPFPKLPVLDPKIIQAVMLGLQARELWKQRKSMSKDNLKKGKDTYSYPLKPKVTKPEPPEVVEIPTNNIKPKTYTNEVKDVSVFVGKTDAAALDIVYRFMDLKLRRRKECDPSTLKITAYTIPNGDSPGAVGIASGSIMCL